MPMQVHDIMTTSVRTVTADSTVQDVAKKMDDENVGALPVCDGEQLIGLVTDRDIVVRSTSAGQDPAKTSVRDVMTAPVTYAIEDQTIEEVAEVMKEQAIRRMPVLDREHHLVGMLSVDDLMLGPQRTAVDVVQAVTDVERPGL
jgi:CBS domain-containing protein